MVNAFAYCGRNHCFIQGAEKIIHSKEVNKFFINQKTGFLCGDPIIHILDNKARIFYHKENKNGILHFNLPPGEYFTKNELQPTTLRKYKLFKLQRPNAKYQIPDNLTVYFGENPNLCTVDHEQHTVFFDVMFMQMPQFCFDYALFHEIGHYLYTGKGQKSEIQADQYSYNKMIEKGYNPSQIQVAIEGVLSNRKNAKQRKNHFSLAREQNPGCKKQQNQKDSRCAG